MTSLMIFTRDLRVDDNQALCAAAAEGPISCMFVMDDQILDASTASHRRQAFLEQCLGDLANSLEALGASLEIARGNWSEQIQKRAHELQATNLHISDDYSSYAKRRLDHLGQWCASQHIEFQRHPGVTALPPGDIQPAGGGEYKVFTPYWRSWLTAPKRPPLESPKTLRGVDAAHAAFIPQGSRPITHSHTDLVGGETHGLERLKHWLRTGVHQYEETRDIPSIDGTSLLSPYLHFGCISPLRLVELSSNVPGSEAFVRQVAWRDFYSQILNARPDASRQDYRNRGDEWDYDDDVYKSWVEGTTGFPLVDAGMRQLQAEGLMHNRLRMVTASFLIKNLHHDWRLGADYFMSQLIDGDVANNYLNWQWVAGTGTDNNPHRVLNPTTQAKRFDKDAKYIRRWVPELSDLSAVDAIDPSVALRQKTGYPLPIVDHHESVEIFKGRRLANASKKPS